VTVYSERPPPSGAAAQIRTPSGPTAGGRQRMTGRTGAPAPAPAPAGTGAKGGAPQTAGAKGDAPQAAGARPPPEDPAKLAETKARKAANCEAARKNLETLEKRGRGLIKTPDGKTVFLSKDDLAARTEESRAQIASNCE
jgi:hypothetical protein